MKANMTHTRDESGFTLVELMIVVAIIGIITAIAYPSYQNLVNGSYRSTAQSDLLGLASAMERHYSATFSYEGAAASGGTPGSPTVFKTYSPSSEPVANKRYDLTIVSVGTNGTDFQIKATPVTSSQSKDDGSLFYFSDGRKGWDQNNNGTLETSEYCWTC